ncbi:MAG: dihydrofolate reductase [Erysipelothrix sp.]|nr:dihydrofolate reductase [Erysipelothrix sp.]
MITLIAAMNKHRTLGLNGTMPWRNREDLQHFKDYTMNKTVVMGRVTYEGLPKKLEGRNIFVVSRDEKYDIQDLKRYLEGDFDEEIVVAGGGEIYKEAIQFADKLVISIIHDNDVIGDTFFPEIDLTVFNKTKSVKFKTFTLEIYKRKDF